MPTFYSKSQAPPTKEAEYIDSDDPEDYQEDEEEEKRPVTKPSRR